jgi:hypothetical protein
MSSLELKENCVKLYQRVDEISASLFGPELMTNCVKKLIRFLHEVTRIEGKLCSKVDLARIASFLRVERHSRAI